MATTKETMKVIAGGVNKKEESEVIMDGRVIAVEMSDELAEVFEGLVEALISKCEDENAERSENDRNNMDREDDGYFMKVEELAALVGVWQAIRAAENMVIILENVNKESALSIVRQASQRVLRLQSALSIVKRFDEADPKALISMLKVLFLSHGMNAAADELTFLNIIIEHWGDTMFYFRDAFFETDQIGWYSMENLLKENTKEQNNRLN